MESEQLIVFLLLLTPVPISIYLLIYIARRRSSVDFPLALIIATAGLWSACYATELSMESLSAKLLVSKIGYIPIVMGPAGWFLLGLQLTDRLRLLANRRYLLLLIVPLLTLAMAFTSDYHTLLWQEKKIVEFQGFQLFRNEYGPGFWIHLVYSYALNLVGAGLSITAAVRSNEFYNRQRISIILALLLTWSANIIYVFQLTDYPVDFTPFAMIGSGLLLALGVFRYQFGDLMPVARERIVAEMNEAILVLDELKRVIDCNRAFQKLFPGRESIIGLSAEELLQDHPRLIQLLHHNTAGTDMVYTGFGGGAYRINSEIIAGTQTSPVQLVIIQDLSADGRLQDALRLVVEGTSHDVGEDFHRSLTRYLALALDTKFAMLAVLDEGDNQIANTLAFWQQDEFRENFTYSLVGAPCENVFRIGPCSYPTGVSKLFPNDMELQNAGVDAYLGTPLISHDGKRIGLLAVMDDKPFEEPGLGLTILELFAMRASTEIERREGERRLISSEENYRRIVETTKDGVCVVGKTGNIDFVNGQMAMLLASSKSALIGQPLIKQFKLVEGFSEDLLSKVEGNLEIALENQKRETRWIIVSKSFVPSGDNSAPGLLYIFSDDTERHLLMESNTGIEEQLRHAQKMESLGVLAGGVAHDFNNLLMPVLGYIDLIKERSGSDPVVIDYLDRMSQAGGKLAELCTQMLTYSGKGRFVESLVDVNEELESMQNLVRASVPSNVSILYSLKDGLPVIKADSTQLNQVTMNLLINASEAMSDQAQGTVNVSTDTASLDRDPGDLFHTGDTFTAGKFVYIEIKDEGNGISEEDQARLFEPFFTTKFAGRGLGMAVVYGIVMAHDGAISIESAAGMGTTLRVYFPTSGEQGVDGVELTEIDSIRVGQVAGKVLVVDDEPHVRNIFHGMLGSMGFETIEAENGELGFKVYKENSLEIVACVIDLTMPGMGGDILSDKIRERDLNIPILLVSGYSKQKMRRGELQSKRIEFLQKPFTLKQFKSALNDCIVR
jgi:PAS domain S-box-containing protein